MKNIIVCSVHYATGLSGSFHFARIVRDLNILTNEYKIFLLTDDFSKNKPDENSDSDTSTLLTFSYKYPPQLFFVAHFIYNWLFYRAIQSFRRTHSLDAVVFNQTCFGVLTRLLLPKSIKIMGIIHDNQSIIAVPDAYHTRKAFWFYQCVKRPLERIAMKNFDVIMANSDYIKRIIEQLTFFKPKSMTRLYQSVNVKTLPFKIHNWQITEGGIIRILFTKSHYTVGGLEDLIQALGLLNSYQFELTAVCLPHNPKTDIATWVKPFSNINLTLKSRQNSEQISELMQSHDILCIPARHEALGLANVEGLAHGISVVSTNVGGIPEVLDNGECGWLAVPHNPAALAETLKNCIEAPPSVRKAKSEYGRRHVEKLFSKERMLSDLLALFDKVVGRD
jgi:colanic acid/amylovoran biosynthesis glycosyltransferase